MPLRINGYRFHQDKRYIHIKAKINGVATSVTLKDHIIVNLDYYSTEPGPYDHTLTPFSDQELKKVTVLRVYGTTFAGQKVCVHIHQVYHYFYIPFTLDSSVPVEQSIYDLGQALNKALDLIQPSDRPNQHIAAVVMVKGVPFYGYHSQHQTFLKIYMIHPYEKQRMIELLQSGAINNTKYQPFEAHINFELQFLIDHNLYGMDWMYVNDSVRSGTQFRLPLSPDSKVDCTQDDSNRSSGGGECLFYTSNTVPDYLQSSLVKRTSYSELELDMMGMSILNRLSVKERDIHNGLYDAKSQQEQGDEEKKKYVKSLESIWKEETARLGHIQPVSEFSTARSSQYTPWMTEENLRKSMERMLSGTTLPSHTTHDNRLDGIITAFQSVEELYPEDYDESQREENQSLVHRMEEEPRSFMGFPSASTNLNLRTGSIGGSQLSSQQIISQLDLSSVADHPRVPILNSDILKSFISEVDEANNNKQSQEEGIQEQQQQQQQQQDEEDNDELDEYSDLEDFSMIYNNNDDDDDEEERDILKWVDQLVDKDEQSVTNPSTSTSNIPIEIEHDEQIVISEIPPVDQQTLYFQEFKKRYRINQWDGVDDSSSEYEEEEEETDEAKWNRISKHSRNKNLLNLKKRRLELKRKRSNLKVGQYKVSVVISEKDSILSRLENRKNKRKVAKKRRILFSSDEDDDHEHCYEREVKIETIEEEFEQNIEERVEERIDEQIDEQVEIKLEEIEEEDIEEQEISGPPANSDLMSSQKSTESLQYFTKQINAMWSPQRSFDRPAYTSSDDFFQKNNPTPGSPNSIRRTSHPHSQLSVGSIGFDLEEGNEHYLPPPPLSFFTSEKKNLESDLSVLAQRKSQSQSSLPSAGSVGYDAEIQDPFDSKSLDWSVIQEAIENETIEKSISAKAPPTTTTTTTDNVEITEQAPTSELFTFDSNDKTTQLYTYSITPPVFDPNAKLPVVYKEPFYSKTSDVPRYPTVFSGKEFKLTSNSVKYLKEFQTKYTSQPDISSNLKSNPALFLYESSIRSWTPADVPPTLLAAEEWLSAEATSTPKRKGKVDLLSQLSGPTQDNTFGFKLKNSISKTENKRQFIDLFSLEIHVNTRENQLPDPEKDTVQAIFWCFQTENKLVTSNGYQDGYHVGIIAIKNFDVVKIGISHNQADITYTEDEIGLFKKLIEKVRYYDPDMLVGYEVQQASWGYLVERATIHGMNLLDELSRVERVSSSYGIQKDQWGYKKSSVYKIPGRHMLNVWRLMRNELTLISYTIENVVFNLLHHRIPYFTHATLTSWYHGAPVLKYRLFKYYLKRVQLNLEILEASQVINRTCEQARVFGIDFYSVLTRGSQYKVESIMFRIAKPENYILISPNRQQVASQRSLECLPLVMEPHSNFYSSPMVVLDFQSLYPSIMIAYNYCYSTCLGRIRDPEAPSTLGVSSLDLPPGLLDTLKDQINVSPNGIMFVKPEIRKSLLAKMLIELLETRVLVKKSMKACKDQKNTLLTLDAKQLTLKLIANVTYGYTAATFSGRMPCAEIADSIVQTGRETLERSVKLINENLKWGAKVVYGDTDSLFIYFPGKTREEAFQLGHEIADTVTAMNPAPVKLKFEKVYHPSVLLTKKRYVGFKYENPTDVEPKFEAKGIETVRRDGTVATQKIFETSLKILFRTQDMSQLKEYLYRQWTKMLANKVPLQDYIISKEVRMGTYSERGGPNGAIVAQEKMNTDHRAAPQYGERVPYVVVHRGPNAKLKDKVVRPETLLKDNSLILDAEYYIRKQIIPPLSRVFNLMGVDVQAWYDNMPRSQKNAALLLSRSDEPKRSNRIDQYYATSHCIACHQLTDQTICDTCLEQKDERNLLLINRQVEAQRKYSSILSVCQGCSGLSPLDALTAESKKQDDADIPCQSLDCTLFYERLKAKDKVRVTSTYTDLLEY